MLARTKARQMFIEGRPILYELTPTRDIIMTLEGKKVTYDFVTQLKREGLLKRAGDYYSGVMYYKDIDDKTIEKFLKQKNKSNTKIERVFLNVQQAEQKQKNKR